MKRTLKPVYKGKITKFAQVYDKDPSQIKVTFPFTLHDVANVKSIAHRRFISEGKDKYWLVPNNNGSIEALHRFGFKFDEKLQERLNSFHQTQIDNKEQLKVELWPYRKITVPGLKGNLLPYQETGVHFIEDKNGCILLADEMGLGKTIQVIAWLQLHEKLRPAIIVCPAVVKWNWARELQKWIPHPKVQVLSGKNPQGIPIIGEILIINYDILEAWSPILFGTHPKVMVLDECHNIKNPKAKRTEAVLKFRPIVPHRIAVSGTPITNRPQEFFNSISFVAPNLFNYWRFCQRYCDAKRNGFGWDFSGASNIKELYDILTSTIMIRRLKKDVLKDLPDKLYSVIPLEIDNRKTYEKALEDVISFIANTKGEEKAELAKGAEVLIQIETLKTLAAQGKFHLMVEWITEFLESGKKLVFMAHHKFMLDALQDVFGDICVRIDGSTPAEQRSKIVESFQRNPEIRLFIGNIKAAGVGITLTAASDIAIGEYPWTPGELGQAIDRVHRIGAKDTVNVHLFVGLNTIEEEIVEILDRKMKVLGQVLDGQEPDEDSLLQELVARFKKSNLK